MWVTEGCFETEADELGSSSSDISWLSVPGVVTLGNFTLVICLRALSYHH